MDMICLNWRHSWIKIWYMYSKTIFGSLDSLIRQLNARIEDVTLGRRCVVNCNYLDEFLLVIVLLSSSWCYQINIRFQVGLLCALWTNCSWTYCLWLIRRSTVNPAMSLNVVVRLLCWRYFVPISSTKIV